MKWLSLISGLTPTKPYSSQQSHQLQWEDTGQEGQPGFSQLPPRNWSPRTRRSNSPNGSLCWWKQISWWCIGNNILMFPLYLFVKANTVLSYHFCRQDNTVLVHRLGWHTRELRSLLQHSELHCWARSDTIRMARARNKSKISPFPTVAHKFATFLSCHKINTSAFNTSWLHSFSTGNTN